jgi:hypothetical protein
VFQQATNNEGPDQKTIDLGGRTIAGGQVPGNELLLKGKHVHVYLMNGTLMLPVACQLVVSGGATLEMRGVQLISNGQRTIGGRCVLVQADDESCEGTTLVYEDCIMRWEKPQHSGSAVVVTFNAQATLVRCWIEDAAIGVWVTGERSKAVVDTCVVQRCKIGYSVNGGATLQAFRCVAVSNVHHGFGVQGPGTVMQAVSCRSNGNMYDGFYAADPYGHLPLLQCASLQAKHVPWHAGTLCFSGGSTSAWF